MFNINNGLVYLIITLNSFDNNIIYAADYRYDKSITDHNGYLSFYVDVYDINDIIYIFSAHKALFIT